MSLITKTVVVIALFDMIVVADVLENIDVDIEKIFRPGNLAKDLQEDAALPLLDLIRKKGYPSEKHTIHSKQGYILEMHRIPYGKRGPWGNRPAVYLQHGIVSSSADWVLSGPEKSFAYILADAGYDVWLPNVRGNKYSRKHKWLDPMKNAKEFWDFTWHEIAMDDVPTMVDYVREQTRQDKIFYIGHSQGTTVSYVMLSRIPKYNDRFRAVFSLSPVAYMKHVISPFIRVLAMLANFFQMVTGSLNMYEFPPRISPISVTAKWFCSHNIFKQVCIATVFSICGFNYEQLNSTVMAVALYQTPAGASFKQLFHYAQEINSGFFCQWDHGFLRNIIIYKRPTPPKYELKNVKAPVYLYYSNNDWLANITDVERLASELGNLQGKFLCTDKKFSHFDYLYGIDAPRLVYYKLIEVMKKH
ncbi:hypothetical protein ILUMI_11805 [Ignelater luminosus]|uniref:Lipase n=1 Tax=Ignelater luminosus TaxID=2038154 RepID=A0A8K0CVB2_IGNLU|nr:hypothetical protein ILUMI_11805 [Ignelater luminosus]